MFKIYCKIFSRHLLQNKMISVINIVGLSIGLAGCLLIALYVQDELSFDKHHPDADKIYRISTIFKGGNEELRISSSAPQIGPLLTENFTEIEAYTRFTSKTIVIGEEGNLNNEENIRFADSNFFSFFQYAWLQGDPETALLKPDSIVLTESFANKYFADEDPMGRTLLLTDGSKPLEVTGLIKDGVNNTHITADAFLTMSTYQTMMGIEVMENWGVLSFESYIKLAEGVSFDNIQSAIFTHIDNNMSPQMNTIFDHDSDNVIDIHLNTMRDPGSKRSKGEDITVLIGICLAILLIACINFINLATARSTERVKEVAMRKVLGSRQRQIFMQYMGESTLMVFLSLVLALGLTELTLPVLNSFTEKNLFLFSSLNLLGGAVVLGGIVALISGLYPSLFLSSFKPLAIFRRQSSQGQGLFSFRNILVIFQFGITITLIVATTVMVLQVQHGKNIELGFDQDRVLVIENSLGGGWEVFKQQVEAQTEVSPISAAGNRPFSPFASSVTTRYEGSIQPTVNLSFSVIDFEYFTLFDVDVLAGRLFSDAFGSERIVIPTEEQAHTDLSFILNRAMVEKLDWTPESAVGKWFEINFSQNFERSVKGRVVGVVENMQVDSVKRALVPQLYYVPQDAWSLDFGFLKIPAKNMAQTLSQIDEIWSGIYQDYPINRYFLDSSFQKLYEQEERQTKLLSVFALLAVVISCMGIFGLASFTAEKRTKEIGVRKVLGASVSRIVLLITYDFSKLVLISNLLAWPVAYFAMEHWLETFAYRIDLTPLIFIGSGLIALCIAWVTVGGTAAKAANAKPVLALRYE